MTGRYQEGEDLKDQGPRQGKQQISLRQGHISVKLKSYSEEKRKGTNITPPSGIKGKSTRPFSFLGSHGDSPSHVHTCAPPHMYMYTCLQVLT